MDKLLEGVRLAVPAAGGFSGMRHSQQLVRPADLTPTGAGLYGSKLLGEAEQDMGEGKEGVAGEAGRGRCGCEKGT